MSTQEERIRDWVRDWPNEPESQDLSYLLDEIDRLRKLARKDEIAMMNAVTLHDQSKCCSALSLIQSRLVARKP